MRIVVNGQQPFGKSVLEALLERGDEVVGVFGPAAKPGQKPDPLVEAAKARNIPTFEPKSFKNPEVWDQLKALAPDLVVMAYVTLLVPSGFLNIPTHGTIQYHPSLLPKHRGPSSINWPIIAGEQRTGLTIFWPDDGLDTGPLLLQKEVEIGPDDTLGTVYFNKLYPLGVQALLESVDLVKQGTAPKIPQNHDEATYEGWCKAPDAKVDWSKPAQQVYNLIRGCNPQPGAWTLLEGKQLQLFDAAVSVETTGDPGTVVAVDATSFTVAAQSGGIVVKRLKPEGSAKVPVADFLATGAIAVGVKFGF